MGLNRASIWTFQSSSVTLRIEFTSIEPIEKMFSSLSYPTIISLVLASLMMCISCTTATVAADPITSSSTHSRTSTQSSYQPLSVDEMKSLFLQFTHKHNKFYQGPKEYQQRFEIFSQNVEKSRQMNLLEGRNTYGVTKFSDLSPEEFKKYYLMEPKTPQLMMSSGVNRNGVLPISRVSQQQVRDAPKVSVDVLVDSIHLDAFNINI